MNIRHIIHYSYSDALSALVMGTSPPALARARERVFFKSLAAQLQAALADADLRVFSAYGRGRQNGLGAEHRLYDIQVCRIETGQTAGPEKRTLLLHRGIALANRN